MQARSLNNLVWTAGEALRRSLYAQLGGANRSVKSGDTETQELHRALEELDDYVRCLEAEKDSAREENAMLQTQVQERSQQVAELQRESERLRLKEKELRRLLLEAHDQLIARDAEIQMTLAHVLRWAGRPMPSNGAGMEQQESGSENHTAAAETNKEIPSKHLEYQEAITQVRRAVDAVVPANAKVLVVSKGDEDLLNLGDRKTGHFPQNEKGVYAGYYPKDGAEAIAAMETLRQRGAEFIVFPSPSLWWLEYYADFTKHLDGQYRRVHQDKDCVIYHLTQQAPPADPLPAKRRRWWEKVSLRGITSPQQRT
jgi:hypothetical protein